MKLNRHRSRIIVANSWISAGFNAVGLRSIRIVIMSRNPISVKSSKKLLLFSLGSYVYKRWIVSLISFDGSKIEA